LKAGAGFRVAALRSEHETQIKICFIDTANAAFGRCSVNGLRLCMATGYRKHPAKIDTATGIARVADDSFAIPRFSASKLSFPTIKMAEMTLHGVTPVFRG